jgi:hypothetical protein
MTSVLGRWEAEWLSETANLLTSELVSNVVRHTDSGPIITAAIAAGFLEVGVTDDHADEVPQIGSGTDPTAGGGRGIAIVEALSADWGVHAEPEGKQVWFRLEVEDWTFLQACRCTGDEHVSKFVLGSGSEVVRNPGPWDMAGSA